MQVKRETTMLRPHLLLGTALIAAAGCAHQPLRVDRTSSSPVSATAASNQLSASSFPPGLLVFAYEQGWREVVAQGTHRYFCRADAPSGSIIPEHRCITEWQMEVERLIVQQQQQFLRQPTPYIPIRYP